MSGKNKYDVEIVEYGNYPQMVPSSDIQKTLEQLFKRKTLKIIGEPITIDSKRYDEYSEKLSPQYIDRYEYNGKIYVRVISNTQKDKVKLSNGVTYKRGDAVWVEISPVRFLNDKKAKILLAEKLLFAGVQFNHERNYKGDFDKTDIKYFLDNCFAKDLLQNLPSKVIPEEPYTERKSRLQKLNPDNSLPNERRKMTDTEIIHDWIESGQSVLLRGPSGIGKTERIKTLYPNLIYLKLTNNMFPEKVVGSMNLQTGQNIPPNFAKQAIMSCATEEEKELVKENIQNIYDVADKIYERSKNSNEKIVIMLDELLNVKPVVQQLVYTLVLSKLVEVDKGLKLPANTVVVATGNQKKYSKVAEDIAEPLEKRFDHILDMEPKVGTWLDEYAIPNKIHPSVIGYILSKYISNGRSEEISDIGYFYEEPEVGEKHLDKYGCNGRTNDPRGWVSISDMLYSFEKNLISGEYVGKNVEDLLQISLETKLREEWATEFYSFYNTPTLSVDDVVNNNYSQSDLPRDTNERFLFLTSILLANENEVSLCRNFIKKYCDSEYLKVYDICWAGNDEKRMEKIVELQEMDTINVVEEGGKRR